MESFPRTKTGGAITHYERRTGPIILDDMTHTENPLLTEDRLRSKTLTHGEAAMTDKIRVLLVDDHTVVRQGLRILFEAEPDIEVVGEAETGRQGVQMARQLLPDVVIMDVAMPMLNGFEATRQIIKEVPTARVLVLSSYS